MNNHPRLPDETTYFMGPKVSIGEALINPVLVHIIQEVVSSKCLDKSIHARAGIDRDFRAVGKFLWRRYRIVLPGKVTILFIRPIEQTETQYTMRLEMN